MLNKLSSRQIRLTRQLKPLFRAVGLLQSRNVRVRNHKVAHKSIQIMTCGDELAERPAAGTECIELFDREALLVVSPPEIGEFLGQLLNDSPIDRIIDAVGDLYVAGIEADLPRVRWRNDNVAADQLAPVHGIAKGRGKQTNAIASLAENPIRFFEHRNPSPF